MKNILPLLSLLFISFFAQAQSHRAFAQAGQKALRAGNCQEAMMDFQNALLKRPQKTEYAYLFAQAAIDCHAFETAEKTLKNIINQSPDAGFQLGLAQKGQGKYAEAKSSLETYITNYPSATFVEIAKDEIQNCMYALAQKGDSPYAIKNLGKKINSPYSEFAPVLRGDTLYYSSFRFDNRKDWAIPRRKISKAVYSTKGRKGRPMRYGFNQDTMFTANLCFLPDGSGVYYNHCHYENGLKVRCDLYFRQKKKKRGWKKPIKLKINNKDFTTTQPSYYVDNQSNKAYILFASDRNGGQGQLDIWMAPITDKHQLGEPVNLTTINTAGNEITPFYDSTNAVFYFSSDDYLNIGGYDIFRVSAPSLAHIEADIEPLPMPINSPANDIFFVPTGDGTNGFLASNRIGAQYIDKQNQRCCNDLYSWTFTPPKPTIPEPEPTDTIAKLDTTPPLPILPVVAPPEPTFTETAQSMLDLLPIRLFFDNDEPDKRTTATTTQKSYLDTYHKYYAHKSQFVKSFCRPLKGDDKENAQYKLEDFFEYDVKDGGEILESFSGLLLRALRNGEQVEIILKGYTSPRAKTDYNKYLAARRISSVKNHFSRFQDGIFNQYIKNGQLLISELPLGEAQTPTGISDDLWDRRMSVYSVEASMERRVEIIDLKIGE